MSDTKVLSPDQQIELNRLQLIVKTVMSRWSLDTPHSVIRVVNIDRSGVTRWAIAYDRQKTHRQNNTAMSTYSGLSLEYHSSSGILYLLHISIADSFRGKGFGAELYRLVVDIAKQLKCREVRQTPSGWAAVTREPRVDYLTRRGWVADNNEVVLRLVEEPASSVLVPPVIGTTD